MEVLEERGIDIHVEDHGGRWDSADVLENQLLPEPLWPGNHPPPHTHTRVPRALWVKGKMRVSQVSRGPCGITFKTLSAGLPELARPAPRSCLGPGLRGIHNAGSSLLQPHPLSAKPDSFTGGILVFISFLMCFPAAVHSSPSPVPTNLPPFLYSQTVLLHGCHTLSASHRLCVLTPEQNGLCLLNAQF